MHSTCKFAHGFFGDEVIGILDRGGGTKDFEMD